MFCRFSSEYLLRLHVLSLQVLLFEMEMEKLIIIHNISFLLAIQNVKVLYVITLVKNIKYNFFLETKAH